MPADPAVKFSQTFKKYTEERRADVLDFARQAAKAAGLKTHEDASIFKVTGAKEQIEGLRATLKEKFGWTPVGIEEPAAK